MSRWKTYEELTIQDNFLFERVMRNNLLCRYLLECILNIKIKKISYPETEKTVEHSYRGKGIRLDVYVEDTEGTLYDIEMQTTNGGAKDELPKRTRYYQSLMDTDVLKKGHPYRELRKTYIIFICTFDPFGKGRSRYTFKETCQEDKSLLLGDASTKIFLNSKGSREGLQPELASFLDYVDGKAAKGSLTEKINSEVLRVKANEEGRSDYMRLLEEFQEQREIGEKTGRNAMRQEMVLDMLKNHASPDFIAKISKLSLDEIRQLASKHHLAMNS